MQLTPKLTLTKGAGKYNNHKCGFSKSLLQEENFKKDILDYFINPNLGGLFRGPF